MPTAKTYNWLVIAVIVLVLINIATLAFLWLGRPKADMDRKQQNGDAKNYIVQQLQLNEIQQKQFDSLRKIHFSEINEYRKELRQLKDQLFEGLKISNDTGYQKRAERIGQLEAQIDLSTYHHFSALRVICDEQQRRKFDDIIQKVLRNLGRPQPGRPGEGPGSRRPGGGPPPPAEPDDSMDHGGEERPPDGPPPHD